MPPVDAGKKDKGTNPGKDNGTKKDKGDPNKTMCDSLAKEPKAAYCIKQAVTCNQASDCCAASTYPIPCGIYANKWACNGGNCVREGCKDKAECVKYATSMNIKTASEYGCNKPFCSFTTSYCAPQAKPCNKPSDCCIAGSKSPCGIYPNHFVCNGGKCKNNGCVTNGECLQFAKSNSLPNQGSYQCFKSTMPCYPSTSYCSTVGPKTCNKPSDCCVASSSIPCGTYGNSFRCVNSTCITKYCKNKQDCKAYAIAAKVPDPDKYNCVPH